MKFHGSKLGRSRRSSLSIRQHNHPGPELGQAARMRLLHPAVNEGDGLEAQRRRGKWTSECVHPIAMHGGETVRDRDGGHYHIGGCHAVRERASAGADSADSAFHGIRQASTWRRRQEGQGQGERGLHSVHWSLNVRNSRQAHLDPSRYHGKVSPITGHEQRPRL